MTPSIFIYGYADGCPACDQLKSFLDLVGVQYDYRPVERGSALRERLRDAGYATLPQAFESLTGRSLGGYSDFRKVARLGLQAGGMLG
jgi:glutaredoxin